MAEALLHPLRWRQRRRYFKSTRVALRARKKALKKLYRVRPSHFDPYN